MKRLVLVIAAALVFSGCDQMLQNKSERSFAQAEQKYALQDYPEAVLLYEASLDGTPKTAEIHYKLGLIYEEKINAPVSAIHHFQRYLEMAPKGAHAREAHKFLKEDQFKLSATLGNGATIPQEEAKRIKNSNLELQKKLLELKEELEAAKKANASPKTAGGKGAASPSKPEQTQKPILPGARTYTVKQGDTLAAISRKFYNNNSAHWKKIQTANFGSMEGTAKLKAGMVLMIP
ncbi:MAG: LysM peptidoglycan-binding domain-containing protein [Verrucomicrobia bacterium]|nr:LysM peptidoglycan-binding domain-containing protein [Verrucomicrobiota bacterium]